jgi:hypothetical protein
MPKVSANGIELGYPAGFLYGFEVTIAAKPPCMGY